MQQLVDLMKSFYAVLPGEQSPSLTSSTAQSPSRSLGYRHLNGIDIDNDNGEKNQNGASRTKIEVTDTNNDEKNQLLTVNGSNSHCTTISQSVPTRLQQDNEIPEVVGVRKFDQDQDHVLGPSVTYTESVTEVKAYKLTLLRLAVSCSINLRQHESCLIENIDLNSRCAKNIPVALAENILRKFQLSNYAISNDDFPKAAPAEATSLRDQDENQINCNENGTREESLDGNIPSPEIIETIKVEGQIMHKLILCSKAESILTQGETLESDYAATSRNLKGEGNNESSDGKDDDGYTADILSIMETLHLLVIKSWNHMEVLPNRLFRNRKCSTSAPSLQ